MMWTIHKGVFYMKKLPKSYDRTFGEEEFQSSQFKIVYEKMLDASKPERQL